MPWNTANQSKHPSKCRRMVAVRGGRARERERESAGEEREFE